MTVKRCRLDDLDVEVTHKDIKNLYLRVSPPDGLVRISAPKRMGMAYIHRFVASRRDWIKQKQRKIRSQSDAPVKQYVDDECHHFSGGSYRLRIIEQCAQPRVELVEKTLDLYIRPGASIAKRRDVLEGWYRQYMKAAIPGIIDRYEDEMGVCVSEFRIRKMKTRWGSCNIRVQRIWLNLELAKHSIKCLESVVVHEMVHLLEPSHNQRFYLLMDRFMPDWKSYEEELALLSC